MKQFHTKGRENSGKLCVLPPAHEPGGTSNIEHPTSNTERRSERGFALPFDVLVGCSMFSLGSGVSTREFSFRGGLSWGRGPGWASVSSNPIFGVGGAMNPRQAAQASCLQVLRASSVPPGGRDAAPTGTQGCVRHHGPRAE